MRRNALFGHAVCDNGSVESLIGKLNGEDDVWKLMADVSSGLGYLHSLEPPIIHQDIKPANILIDTNKNYCVTDLVSVSNRVLRMTDISRMKAVEQLSICLLRDTMRGISRIQAAIYGHLAQLFMKY